MQILLIQFVYLSLKAAQIQVKLGLFLQAFITSRYNDDQMLRSSGISISSEFTQVEGRVLPAPRVNICSLAMLVDFSFIISESGWFEVFFFLLFLLILLLFTDTSLQLTTGNGEEFLPRNGRWNFNNKVLLFFCNFILLVLIFYTCYLTFLFNCLQKFVDPVKIENWAVVNFSARCDILRLVKDLRKIGEAKGLVSML